MSATAALPHSDEMRRKDAAATEAAAALPGMGPPPSYTQKFASTAVASAPTDETLSARGAPAYDSNQSQVTSVNGRMVAGTDLSPSGTAVTDPRVMGNALLTAIPEVAVTMERPIPTDLGDYLDQPGEAHAPDEG